MAKKGPDGRPTRLPHLLIGVSVLVGIGAALPGPATAQVIDEFLVPTSDAYAVRIVAGPDGNLWFTEESAGKIGRITPAGVITEFALPSSNASPVGIAPGADGNLWFTEYNRGIGRIRPEGSITEFPLPEGHPAGIAAGPDGNVWYADVSGRIGRITPQGSITEFPVAGDPTEIAAGHDGNLWFTKPWGNLIGRITPGGVVTEFPVPTMGVSPYGVAAGPDGNVWFTEYWGPAIGRITPDGTITEFPLPQWGGLPDLPVAIAAGPDGNLWFTQAGGMLGRITTSGSIVQFPLPSTLRWPTGIASGPDGGIWFTSGEGNEVARLALPTFSFFTVTPCRVLDTRDAGKGGPAPFVAGSSNQVTVLGRCGIPTTALSVSLNVTVTAPTTNGYLGLYRSGFPPPDTSTINYSAGRTRSNNAVVQLGGRGTLAVGVGQASGTVHVIVDVNGYFQ